jgi:DNA-binding NarL/FixJ family response regulator
MSITVLLADDTAIIRQSIVSLLQAAPDVEIVAQASNYRQTIDLATKLYPHVIVLDIHMGDEQSQPSEQLKSHLTGSCLLAISLWADDETKSFAKNIGAVALLDKVELATQLIPAIRSCASDQK